MYIYIYPPQHGCPTGGGLTAASVGTRRYKPLTTNNIAVVWIR